MVMTRAKFRAIFKSTSIYCLALLFPAISCQKKKAETAGYSVAFKPVLDHVSFLFGTNKVLQGLLYLDSSLNRLNKPTIDDRFRAYAFHYVYWNKTVKDYKKAILYADSMLLMANQSVTKQQYVANFTEANFAMGDSYFSLEQYNQAYQHYFKGYVLGKKNLNKSALSDYAYRIGMIMYKMQNFKLAVKYFKECYLLSTTNEYDFGNFYRKQEVLDNVALSFKHSNQPDSAIVYFNKALKYLDTYGPQYNDKLKLIDIAKAVADGNKAEVLIDKKEYPSAIELLKNSIVINLQKDYDNIDAVSSEVKLAKLYFKLRKDDSLLSLLHTMRIHLDTIKDLDSETDWNYLMSRYYTRKKDSQNALNYLQAYNRLNDSITRKLNLLRESDINKQLDSFEKQSQIDNLKDNNKLQKIYLYVAIICALMALCIIFLIYKNWRRSRRDVQVVNTLNQQINRQKADLEETLEELKSSSMEKDRILRTVAHDLRNPIGGIASLTMVMDDEHDPEEQREMIKLIRETSHNSLELINEILEVTNNGDVALKKELVDINLLLSNSVELLRFKASEKDQFINLELSDKPVELLVSREKIWRVFSNLISNAVKFSPTGGTIQVKITNLKTEIVIAVSDNGIGIPENMKQKLFNVYTEAKRSGTAGEKSFGLGLSISKQIVENHGGKIWFENNAGKGATFYVCLPKNG